MSAPDATVVFNYREDPAKCALMDSRWVAKECAFSATWATASDVIRRMYAVFAWMGTSLSMECAHVQPPQLSATLQVYVYLATSLTAKGVTPRTSVLFVLIVLSFQATVVSAKLVIVWVQSYVAVSSAVSRAAPSALKQTFVRLVGVPLHFSTTPAPARQVLLSAAYRMNVWVSTAAFPTVHFALNQTSAKTVPMDSTPATWRMNVSALRGSLPAILLGFASTATSVAANYATRRIYVLNAKQGLFSSGIYVAVQQGKQSVPSQGFVFSATWVTAVAVS